ncbi:hypothetical protein M0804_001030 [Polistes exclamans]|nr:hypothetical protein M0804_001030 [Polistes exclamans]
MNETRGFSGHVLVHFKEATANGRRRVKRRVNVFCGVGVELGTVACLEQASPVKFPNRDGQVSGAPEFGDKCPVKCDTHALSGIKISNANDHRRFSVPPARSEFTIKNDDTVDTDELINRTSVTCLRYELLYDEVRL